MRSEWPEYNLDSVYDIRSGLSKPASEFGYGFPFLSFKDVFHNYFVPAELHELVNSSERERENCSVKRGDVFLTRTSETSHELGLSCVALSDVANATFNGFTKRLRPKPDIEIDPVYAGYYFRSPGFRAHVTSMSSQSTRASLNNEMLGHLTIKLPRPAVQQKIASILKPLDDRIEVCRKENETLEAMAQALFKSWFVEFDPVIDKALAAGNPIPEELAPKAARRQALAQAGKTQPLPEDLAALFPDSFEDSALGPIPEGWEVGSIAEIARYVNGKNFTKNASGIGKMVIRIAELNSGPGSSTVYNSVLAAEENQALPGDILFAWSGSLGVYRWFREEALINQHIFKVIPTGFPDWFVHYALLTALPWFREIASHKATTMGHIKRGHLAEKKLPIPPKGFLRDTNCYFAGAYEKVLKNEQRSAQLTELRDNLLPKLISGEIQVK